MSEVPPARSDRSRGSARPDRARGAAGLVVDVVEPLLGGRLPFRVECWDGTAAGSHGGPTVVLRRPRALRRVLFHPGELGLAQAYVTGDLDVEGDLLDGLRQVWQATREHTLSGHVDARTLLAGLRRAAALGVIGVPPRPPRSQARLRGRLHTRRRDRAAISHHYDVSSDFYALFLDPSMAYSCGYWTRADPSYTLADAQHDKLDLVCRKLGLATGSRLLDVGCGWGSLTVFAAREYAAHVTAVTLSTEQRTLVRARLDEAGLATVDVRLQDYREVDDGPYDAIACIEMGEHVGAANYPSFAARLHALLKPTGRVLVQQMSRRTRPGGGPFIEAFIAPDMHMRPVGETVSLLEDAGLEVCDVQGLREHYVRTIRAWYDAFEARWSAAVDLVGEEAARVWRLYMVGAALSFEEGRMGVDQILGVRPEVGSSGLPAVRTG